MQAEWSAAQAEAVCGSAPTHRLRPHRVVALWPLTRARRRALLAAEFVLWLGLSRQAKVLDLKERVRCRGCGKKGRAVMEIKWRRQSG